MWLAFLRRSSRAIKRTSKNARRALVYQFSKISIYVSPLQQASMPASVVVAKMWLGFRCCQSASRGISVKIYGPVTCNYVLSWLLSPLLERWLVQQHRVDFVDTTRSYKYVQICSYGGCIRWCLYFVLRPTCLNLLNFSLYWCHLVRPQNFNTLSCEIAIAKPYLRPTTCNAMQG